MKIIPLNSQVVVEPEDTSTKSQSGIIIPDTAEKDAPVKGIVFAVDKNNPDLKKGDFVIYSKYGGSEVTFNNKNYIIISSEDILAKIHE